MARRTKEELELMKELVRGYLKKTDNHPHQAFELMVKECLLSGKPIPSFVKGVSDFIKESQRLAG